MLDILEAVYKDRFRGTRQNFPSSTGRAWRREPILGQSKCDPMGACACVKIALACGQEVLSVSPCPQCGRSSA